MDDAVDPIEYSPPRGDTPLGDRSMDDLNHGPRMDLHLIEDKPDTDLNKLTALLQRDEKLEIQDANREILAVIRSLGGDRGRYRREGKRAIRHVVSEIYSPPRVPAAIK